MSPKLECRLFLLRHWIQSRISILALSLVAKTVRYQAPFINDTGSVSVMALTWFLSSNPASEFLVNFEAFKSSVVGSDHLFQVLESALHYDEPCLLVAIPILWITITVSLDPAFTGLQTYLGLSQSRSIED